MSENSINRRDFVKTASIVGAGLLLSNAISINAQTSKKRRYAIVGTGHRATGMWGVDLAKNYSNGANMSYSLDAHEPIEGYRAAFNGTKGRLEVRDYERQPWAEELQSEIYLMKNYSGKRERIEMPNIKGGHSGGDDRLRDVIFKNAKVPDILKLPDSRAGAMSCLTGIAARTSIEQSRPIKISELIKI